MDVCMHCSEYKTIQTISEIEKGDHIVSDGFKLPGVECLYRHHAIITAVDDDRGVVKTIEFVRNDDESLLSYIRNKGKIMKKKYKFKSMPPDVRLVKHLNMPNRDVIVKRAEKLFKEFQNQDKRRRYNFIANNCEHLAMFCITGRSFCLQVSTVLCRVGCFGQVVHFLLKIAKKLKHDHACEKLVKCTCVEACGQFGICFFFACSAAAISICITIADYMNKYICGKCMIKKITKTIVALLLTVYGTAIVTSFFTSSFATFAVMGIVAIVFLLTYDVLFEKIWKLLDPHSDIRRLRLMSFAFLKPGCVINYDYYKFPHDAVVVGCRQLINAVFIEDENGRRKYKTERLRFSEEDIVLRLKPNREIENMHRYAFTCEQKIIAPTYFLSMVCRKHFLIPYRKEEIGHLTEEELKTVLMDNGTYIINDIPNLKELHDLRKKYNLSYLPFKDGYSENFPDDDIFAVEKSIKVRDAMVLTLVLIFITQLVNLPFYINIIGAMFIIIGTILGFSEKVYDGDGLEEISFLDIKENDIICVKTDDGRIRKYLVTTMNEAELDVVHYGFESRPGVSDLLKESSRVVKKETVLFNLKTDRVEIFDYKNIPPEKLNDFETVVEKAESQIGNRDWKFYKNWSSDFCRACKMK